MRRSLVLSALLLGGCAVSEAIDSLDLACPPPEFGRPTWVRFCAGAGAWVGGAVGAVVSVACLPVTYPISLLAADEIGDTGKRELLFFPAIGGASVGHACLGGVADVVDYTFYRAWFGEETVVTSYEFVPQQGPAAPRAEAVEEKPGS